MRASKKGARRPHVAPSMIKNRDKRAEVYRKYKNAVAEDKLARRKERKRLAEEAEARGEPAPPKPVGRTIENARDYDDTMVAPDDEEVRLDEAEDEFARIFAGDETPRVLITTRKRPSNGVYAFISELLLLIPNSFFYNRRMLAMKKVCEYSANRGFTHVLVVGEKSKQTCSILLSRVPDGPTALFRMTSVQLGAEIRGHGNPSKHRPELILTHFDTRLGHRIGRLLGSCFPHDPEFHGRRVVTLHNQRDFIFVRHHRYAFADDGKRARLQELGPRLTLRLKWLLAGSFDTKQGSYEWYHRKRRLGTGKRRFHL